jgi:F0F1-type ATP synthase membrane subunit c/vacuolar-type H+-ATPase subunit K
MNDHLRHILLVCLVFIDAVIIAGLVFFILAYFS